MKVNEDIGLLIPLLQWSYRGLPHLNKSIYSFAFIFEVVNDFEYTLLAWVDMIIEILFFVL